MIESITIIDLEKNKFYSQKLYCNTLFFSSDNNHGKTVIIRSIIRALGTEENFDKKKDNIDLNKMIIIISINKIEFIRYKKNFFICENNSIIELNRKEYNDKLLSIFHVGYIPSIPIKNGNYSNSYLDILFTFFYINPDYNGDFWSQLKCNMYKKNDVKNYFYELQLNDYDLEILEQNENLINSNELLKKDRKEKENLLKNLEIFFNKISNKQMNNIYLSKNIDNEMNDLKKYISNKYKEKWNLEKKINENKNIINYLENIKFIINKKYDNEFLNKEIDYYVLDEKKENEFKLKVKLLDFIQCNEFIKSIYDINVIDEKICEIKEENKNNLLTKETFEKEILEMKNNFNNFILINEINVLSEEFFKIAFEKDFSDLKKIKDDFLEKDKIINENLKNIKKIISNSKKLFDINFEKFKQEYNWKGGTNSSSFSEIIFMYSKLKQISKFEKMPLIIDAFGKMELDLKKKQFIISGNNQKIFAITSQSNSEEIIFF